MKSRWFFLSILFALFAMGSVACGPECPEGQTKCGEKCINLKVNRNNCGACDKKCVDGEVCSEGVCSVSCQSGLTNCNGSCVNTKTSAQHCGACGTKCEVGQACIDSNCKLSCPESQTACGDSCVDTKTNSKHCGKCNEVCKEGEACKEGKCEIECPKDLKACSDSCVNVKADRKNCGDCGKACEAGQVCNDGKCATSCQKDLTDCSGACVNTKTDTAHCGACGTACKGGEVCKDGKCELTCQAAFTKCNDTCVDTKSSTKHCGGCGNACKDSEVCEASKCKLSCPKGLTDCNGKCVDLNADAAHCGKCDAKCATAQVCDAGACKAFCQTGFTDCSNSCVNLQNNNQNCGKCGDSCALYEKCAAGKCKASCPTGEVDCSGTCVDFQTDTKNCGGCGTACKTDEICKEGKCDASCKGCPNWAIKAGGTNSEILYNMAVDSKGNVYITGYFSSSTKFGPINLQSAGGSDVFVVKFSPSGKVLWARQAGGASSDYGYGIDVDRNGNVYVAGYFNTSAVFGTVNLSSKGSGDIFLAKLDSTGKWLWAQGMGSTSSDYGYDVAVDGSGNAHIAGYFYNTMVIGTTTLTSKGSLDTFVAKFDTAGKAQWAKSLGGTNSDYGRGVAVDGSGNVYVAGYFYSTNGSFGTTTMKTKGSGDAFVAKYSSSGAEMWIATGGGSSYEAVYDLAVDSSGNAYISGVVNSNAVFGNTTLSTSGYDVLIAKVDNTGKWAWAVNGGGGSSDHGYAIGLDSKGNVYATGYFYGPGKFGQTTVQSSSTSAEIFLVQVNSSGKIAGATSLGGSGSDYGYALRFMSGSMYLAGYFSGDTQFGETILLTSGSNDAFVAKFPEPTATLCPGTTGYNVCSGICIDTSSDKENCGACGKKCAGEQICGGGKCRECTDCPKNVLFGESKSSSQSSVGHASVADSSGNIYFTGVFRDQIVIGTTTLKSLGGFDVFVAKYDKTGKVLWATSFGGTGSEYAYGIDVNKNGDVAVAGIFQRQMNVGLSTIKTVGTSSFAYDAFVVLITSAGKPLRAASGGSTSSDYAYRVAFDPAGGGVYVGGYGYGGTFGTINVPRTSGYDAFVGRIDLTGKWTFVKFFGGTSSDYLRGLSVDKSGNLYAAGYTFSSSGMNLDSLSTGKLSTSEAWVAKLDKTGKGLWLTTGGGNSSQYVYDSMHDSKGNVYITGYILSSGAVFGNSTLKSTGSNDMFIAKIDTNGKWSWAKNFGSTSPDYGYGVGVNSKDMPYLAGYFYNTMQVGPFKLTSKGSTDVAIIKMDANGNVLGAASGGGSSSDYPNSLYVDAAGHSYISGYSYSRGVMKFSTKEYKFSSVSTPISFLIHYGPTPCPTSGPFAVCGEACVNVNEDNNNCGACGTKCSTGQSCSNGSCK